MGLLDRWRAEKKHVKGDGPVRLPMEAPPGLAKGGGSACAAGPASMAKPTPVAERPATFAELDALLADDIPGRDELLCKLQADKVKPSGVQRVVQRHLLKQIAAAQARCAGLQRLGSHGIGAPAIPTRARFAAAASGSGGAASFGEFDDYQQLVAFLRTPEGGGMSHPAAISAANRARPDLRAAYAGRGPDNRERRWFLAHAAESPRRDAR